MDYKEFVQKIIQQLKSEMKEETIIPFTTLKNNDKERIGIGIRKPDVDIAPGIYLEEYYRDYLRGVPIERIVEGITSLYRTLEVRKNIEKEKFLYYEKVKNRLAMRLVNTALNQKLLTTVPHMDFLDLSIVFYLLLEDNATESTSMLITSMHTELWKIQTDTLWKDAIDNISNLLPAEFFTLRYAMDELIGRNSNGVPENLLRERTGKADSMYVLTNRNRTYGASCMVYPHILEKVADVLGTDFYILPSSIHEVLIAPCCNDSGSTEEINTMIREINQSVVDDEEVLSGHCYKYSMAEHKVFVP